MQEIYRAADITEAHIIAGMLDASGIESHVGGHYLQGGVGELGAMNCATVSVTVEDVDRGLELIREYEQATETPIRLSQNQGVQLSRYMYLPLILLMVCILIYWIAI